MNDFMLDTSAFNKLLDQSFNIDQIRPGLKLFATRIQEDELRKTPDVARREQLVAIFSAFIDNESLMSTETMVWGVGRWGEGKWGASGGHYPALRVRLDELEKKKNNVQDALVAETAILKNLCLVTDDKNLSIVTKEFGGRTLSVKEFVATNSEESDGS